jgi:aspartyl-tRNA(Asn)/glutamyl-tRNA(Gln) amidotransferase subunit C
MAHQGMNVHEVAKLARITLSSGEEEELGRQLGQILDYVAKLNALDVSGVEPMAHGAPRLNVTRPDQPEPGLSQEEALANAPAQGNGLILVPRIVE